VRGVFDSVASRYDVMNDLMSFGVHRLWKRFAIGWPACVPGSTYWTSHPAPATSPIASATWSGRRVVVMTDINAAMLASGATA
jgi:demethylmenaquinone methyltransferase/2-methoxy-6-polyprenyl-1,4-benzoquinol methylase